MIDDERKEAFSDLCRNASVIHIFMHNNPAPDLDSIGAAMGLSLLIKSVFGKEALIFGVPVSHAQNKRLLAEVDITMHDPSKLVDFREDYTYMLVDTQPGSGSCTIKLPRVDWAIDHHITSGDCTLDPSVHVECVGSASTLVTEYLQAFNFKFNKDDTQHTRAATALALGLMMDTQNLRKSPAKQRDNAAFLYLTDNYDEVLYEKVENYKLNSYVFDYMNNAHHSKKIVGPIMILNVGFVNESRRDCLSQIADSWIRRDGTHMVIAYAVVGQKIVASVRTDYDSTIKAVDLVKALFPSCNSGGRRDAAGAMYVMDPFWEMEVLDDKGKEEFLNNVTSMLVARAKRVADVDE